MDKKSQQLGMSFGAACNRLRKLVLFELVKQSNRDTCFRCGKKILTVGELTIEHKQPWQDSTDTVSLFFDWSNIDFSHHICNVRAARRPNRKYSCRQELLDAKARSQREHYDPEKRREKRRLTGF